MAENKKIILKTQQDIEDFIVGCTFYGTGGGGFPEIGQDALLDLWKKGKEIAWDTVEDREDDIYTACPFFMGSMAATTPEIIQERQRLGALDPGYTYLECLENSIRMLERRGQVTIELLIPGEPGGSNMPLCLAAGIELGIAVADGDYSGGRAIPGMDQGLLSIRNKNILPMVISDLWGNQCVLEHTSNDGMLERIGKHLSMASFGATGNAAYLMSFKEAREVMTTGTLSKCYEVGRLIRTCAGQGKHPVSEMISKLNGFLLGEGEIISICAKDEGGYYQGEFIIQEAGSSKDAVMSVWFKNENHIFKRNHRIEATSPDFIITVDTDTGRPFVNSALRTGMKVSVIGLPADRQYRTADVLSVFGPRAFGVDMEYQPIEALCSGRLGKG